MNKSIVFLWSVIALFFIGNAIEICALKGEVTSDTSIAVTEISVTEKKPGFFDKLKSGLKTMGEKIKQKLTPAKKTTEEKPKEKGPSAWEKLKQKLTPAKKTITEGAVKKPSLLEQLKTKMKATGEKIKQKLTPAKKTTEEKTKEKGPSAWEKFKQKITPAKKTTETNEVSVSKWEKFKQAVAPMAKKAGEAAIEAGKAAAIYAAPLVQEAAKGAVTIGTTAVKTAAEAGKAKISRQIAKVMGEPQVAEENPEYVEAPVEEATVEKMSALDAVIEIDTLMEGLMESKDLTAEQIGENLDEINEAMTGQVEPDESIIELKNLIEQASLAKESDDFKVLAPMEQLDIMQGMIAMIKEETGRIIQEVADKLALEEAPTTQEEMVMQERVATFGE